MKYLKKYRVIIVLISILLGIIFFVWSNDDKFLDTETYIEKLKYKDRDIYNKLKVKEIKKDVKGIDISSWQGEIDFDKVKNDGIDFVMIRCGFRSTSTDKISVDKTFHYNIREANRVGIPVGIYFYSTAKNEKEAAKEASFVLNLIKDYEVIYPVVYDFESFGKNRTSNISSERINDNAKVFLKYIEEHGYEAMLYSNLNDLKNNWEVSKFDDYKIWFAHYIDETNYTGRYEMWQYADNGRVSGIRGDVDLNESYFSYEIVEE
ncbi:MAG: glycoside hydrolase family 25 protein [Bacilli bacterium]|nr:glycoside hydrolase family 25 protein [Bacilli bacterium]